MDLGFYYLNFNSEVISAFFAQGTYELIISLIALGGWLILAWMLIYSGVELWVKYRIKMFTHNWKWVVLAIDVPAMNIQTPKAVEQMFNHLSGAFNHLDITEKFWHGFKQRYFSFEIISIEGYIQFLVRTEEMFRDLVEAAIYAQYPDAEITEVEDYVSIAPDRYPDPEYEVWCADFGLTEHWSRPLRTYDEFEHKISKDTVLKDPMGTFLESFTRIGQGEQMWFQVIVEPIDSHWKEEVIHEIEKITGAEGHGHHGSALMNTLDSIPTHTLKTIEMIGDQIFGREASEAEEHEEEKKKELAPGQGALIEGMEKKMLKVGFKTKMRGVYLAKKEIYKRERGTHALIGAITQFNIPSANSLAPVLTSAAVGPFANRRMRRKKAILMKAYKKRKIKSGGNSFILNIMELASIWHFPMSHVKTPLVQKAVGKKAEAPAGLPLENIVPPPAIEKVLDHSEEKNEKKTYLTDSGHTVQHQDFG